MKPLSEATDQELERAWKEYQERHPEQEPAPPLANFEDEMDQFWIAWPDGETELITPTGMATREVWIEAGRLFPPTPEGRAGAELRAAQGVVPHQWSLTGWVEPAPDYMPVPPEPDWHRDLERLQDWWTAAVAGWPNAGMHIKEFIGKYKRPPVPDQPKNDSNDIDDLMKTCRSES